MSNVPIVVEGVRNPEKVARLETLPEVELRFAKGADQLRVALDGAPIMFGFGFWDQALPEAWGHASDLEWIQWSAAGVDSLLFPELIDSEVIVTNASGVFDDAIAEWVAGAAISFCQDFPRSWDAQRQHKWEYFPGRRLAGSRAAIIGAGSIGTAIARMLDGLGVEMTLFASSNRIDPEFGQIHAWDPSHEAVKAADWVIAVLPNTPAASGMLDREVFAAMSTGAVFMNVGRGDSVVEGDLQEALRSGTIAGAALDVVQNEPVGEDSPWWDVPNLFLTPHNSGDVGDSMDRILDIFIDNFTRYRAGEPLKNVVDKRRGY